MKKKGSSSRFPVARIKKIMQADDDVGKVAQATPLLVSKAVEMFMQSLVQASVYQAQARGSRKVQAYHLKQAVLITESFDFLKDIVSTIPDPTTSSTTAPEDELKPRQATLPAPKPSSSRTRQTKDENDDDDEDDEEEETHLPPTGATVEDEEDDEEYY